MMPYEVLRTEDVGSSSKPDVRKIRCYSIFMMGGALTNVN